MSATGNVTGGNVLVSGVLLSTNTVSATGNITGGNVLVSGVLLSTNTVSATGNITGGNILGGANVNATTHTGATVSVTGNITGGNVLVSGVTLSTNTVSAAGTVTGTGFVSTGATVISANVNNAGMELGLLNAVNTPYIDFHSSGNAATDYDARIIASSGNIGGVNGTGILTVNASTLVASAAFSAAGNVTGGNLITVGVVSGSSEVLTWASTAASYSATGNVTGGNVLANEIFYNSTTIDSSFTTTAGFNALVAGPITVQNGVVGTVSNGTTWQIVG